MSAEIVRFCNYFCACVVDLPKYIYICLKQTKMADKKKFNWLALAIEVIKVVASFILGTQIPL